MLFLLFRPTRTSFQMDPVIPFTFPTRDAYFTVERPLDKRFRAELDFRSYNRDGLLVLNQFTPKGRFQVG